MSSREIAELTGKNHFDVIRDIRVMLEQLGEVESNFAGYYKASNGKQNPLFNLPKDLTITLVSGYNVQMRHRIVTRWMELEEKETQTLQPPHHRRHHHPPGCRRPVLPERPAYGGHQGRRQQPDQGAGQVHVQPANHWSD